MKYLPLFLNLKGRPILVVGGGNIAFRKIQMIQKIGAVIQVVSQKLCPELNRMFLQKKIIWIGKIFQPSMLETVFLVIVATNNSCLNSVVFQNAEKKCVLVNTVDDQNKCSCIFPAIVDRSPILIGISSCGKAPVLVRILREKLESFLPESITYLAKLSGLWRNRVKKQITNIESRRRFWEKIFYDGYVAFLIDQGNLQEASRVLRHYIDNINFDNLKQGNVILVGAGPGDKGLLTLRGLQVIQQADVILYDHLVNSEILDLARRDSDKICVGKYAGKHTMSQENLNNLMIQLAQQGKNVVRLKGGDSFVFGRGGEELQKISKAGIPFQVVPGITAAIGISAYSGIPLTHRKYAHSVVFITGHHVQNNNPINWSLLSDNHQTIVVYMGKSNAVNISKNLICYGRHSSTPVAIISRGTYLDQKVTIGTLIELEKLIFQVDKPVLLIIGKVVSLYNKTNWFGN